MSLSRELEESLYQYREARKAEREHQHCSGSEYAKVCKALDHARQRAIATMDRWAALDHAAKEGGGK